MTNLQLAEQFERFLQEKRGYVWGMQGALYTQELAEKLHGQAVAGRKSVPEGRDPKGYYIGDCSKWIGRYVDDCSGGIVDAIRQYDPTFGDRTADTFQSQFTQSGPVEDIPEIPGLALWRKGHIGVYIGGGYGIEFRGTDYGCVKTSVHQRDWTLWGKIRGVDYGETPPQAVYGMCTGGSVHVRSGPGKEYPAIGVVHAGDRLLLLQGEGWPQAAALIDGKLMVGYLSDKYARGTILDPGGQWPDTLMVRITWGTKEYKGEVGG